MRPYPILLIIAATLAAGPAATQEPNAFDQFLNDAGKLLDSAGTVVRQSYEDTTQAIDRTLVVPADPSFGALASKLIGADVQNTDGIVVAEVEDFVVAPDGKIALAVLRRGGALGIGGELVAADYALLTPTEIDGKPGYVLTGGVSDLPPYRAAGQPE
jgi:hypothetical protein